MEFSDQDKQVIKGTVELLWKKGTHTPDEAAVAFNFTEIAKRILAPAKEPMLKNADEVKKKG